MIVKLRWQNKHLHLRKIKRRSGEKQKLVTVLWLFNYWHLRSMDDVICYFKIMVTGYLKIFGSISYCISSSACTLHELCLVNIAGKLFPPVYICIYILNMSCVMFHARKVSPLVSHPDKPYAIKFEDFVVVFRLWHCVVWYIGMSVCARVVILLKEIMVDGTSLCNYLDHIFCCSV